MIGASIDLGPLDRVFGAVRARAADWRQPFTTIGHIALQQFEHRFDVGGPGWPPNQKGTRLMVRTGRLMRSFSLQGHPENLFRVGATVATFGSRVPYANILQRGGTVRRMTPRVKGKRRRTIFRARIPARPVVVPPDSDFRQKIGRVSFSHFRDAMLQAGGRPS